MKDFVYQVIKNGNEVVFTHSNRMRALHKAISLSKNISNYVELWYVQDNFRTLLNYWN